MRVSAQADQSVGARTHGRTLWQHRTLRRGVYGSWCGPQVGVAGRDAGRQAGEGLALWLYGLGHLERRPCVCAERVLHAVATVAGTAQGAMLHDMSHAGKTSRSGGSGDGRDEEPSRAE